MRNSYSVASVKPFWRFAVGIEERPDLPAIPFYRRASAEVMADEVHERFPERTVVLITRLWRGIDVCVGGKVERRP